MTRKKLCIKVNDFNSLHTNIETYFDEQQNVIHILDRQESGMTVTNSLEFYLRPHILNAYSLDVDNVRWIVYHTDGFISEFVAKSENSGDFKSIADNDKVIYQPFLTIIEDIREVVGYLELFKDDIVPEPNIENIASYLPDTGNWIRKFNVIKKDLLEIFCGVEGKDEQRSLLAKEIRKALQDGYNKTATFTQEKKEIIIVSITAYLCAQFGLTKEVIAYGIIQYILSSFANVAFNHTREKLCKGFEKQEVETAK
ncbi:hypothetical protein OWP22_15910 [Bacillus paranthracis]|uniref:hypothetical protein n=1 Tax=Bacillus paranthracis TaxID=2026186 RepID=UPI00254D3955|nr:hypothetical protein [Bacillus paranthracis]MDK7490385.1 hypothetical protein [Bacillus paranthracis]